MGFLRRLLGGAPPEKTLAEDATPAVGDREAAADEAAYELEVLREEQERLSELARRQMRYAEYAWTPPAQGGDRRADDEEAGTDTESADEEPG